MVGDRRRADANSAALLSVALRRESSPPGILVGATFAPNHPPELFFLRYLGVMEPRLQLAEATPGRRRVPGNRRTPSARGAGFHRLSYEEHGLGGVRNTDDVSYVGCGDAAAVV